MICPYNRKALKQVVQVVNNLVDEDTGIIKSRQDIILEEYTQMECLKENCGAWQEGKCCYYNT